MSQTSELLAILSCILAAACLDLCPRRTWRVPYIGQVPLPTLPPPSHSSPPDRVPGEKIPLKDYRELWSLSAAPAQTCAQHRRERFSLLLSLSLSLSFCRCLCADVCSEPPVPLLRWTPCSSTSSGRTVRAWRRGLQPHRLADRRTTSGCSATWRPRGLPSSRLGR